MHAITSPSMFDQLSPKIRGNESNDCLYYVAAFFEFAAHSDCILNLPIIVFRVPSLHVLEVEVATLDYSVDQGAQKIFYHYTTIIN